MTRLFLAVCILAVNFSFAQTAPVSAETKSNQLNDRYLLMKSSSQTFQDYKVIKEVVLDGFWRQVLDSVRSQKNSMREATEKITQLEASLHAIEATLKKEHEEAAEIIHASTHISVLGIEFKKSVFLTILTFVLAAFVIGVGLIIAKMKMMSTNMKEKILIADLVTKEYDDFKRKALEKQTKLSRELQNERNKLEELRTR